MIKISNFLKKVGLSNKISDLKQSTLNDTLCDITTNSSNVSSHWCFVALKGKNVDGHDFIHQALSKGASLIIAEESERDKLNHKLTDTDLAKCLFIKDSAQKVSLLCSVLYADIPNYIAMVTGTNGKTSVCSYVTQIMDYLGIPNATIGTLGTFFNQKEYFSKSLTTLVPADLFRTLFVAKEQNINHVVMEASSEGLAQGRLNLVPCNVAAFTNLSQDHLNFHHSMENYFEAKAYLFKNILNLKKGVAVINADDEYSNHLISICLKNRVPILSYGKSPEANLRIINVIRNSKGISINIEYLNQNYQIDTHFISDFQIYNLLCALGILLGLNVAPIENLIPHIQNLKDVKGRLELAGEYNGAKIFIDYAHTPDALRAVLSSLRELSQSRLKVMFGCGGERDKKKRPIMGAVASKYADFCYITTDNPRNELACSIISDIIQGFKHENYEIIQDRKQALKKAIKDLLPNDILVVAGKGHEDIQIIGNNTIFHNDLEYVKQLIAGKVSENYDK